MNVQPKGIRRSRWAAIGAAVAVTLGAGGLFAAEAASEAGTVYHAVVPVRVLDTRDGTGAPVGSLGQEETLDLSFAGKVPATAESVSVNITVIGGTQPSFLTVYPTGETRSVTSTINWMDADAAANEVTLMLGVGQTVTIYNGWGSVHVIADLLGFSTPAELAAGPAGPAGPAGAVGPAGPAGPPGDDAQTLVSSLADPWEATNPTVSLTPDGVEFGPYADGGAAGGSIYYAGLNGQPMSVVESLVYYARYVTSNDSGGVGVPYLRIFTDDGAGGENSSIFSPNTQAPDADIAEGPFHEWVATSGSWRYNDDAGNNPDIPFADLIADHGDELITGIYITTGFSSGTDLAALLRWLEINGERFVFQG